MAVVLTSSWTPGDSTILHPSATETFANAASEASCAGIAWPMPRVLGRHHPKGKLLSQRVGMHTAVNVIQKYEQQRKPDATLQEIPDSCGSPSASGVRCCKGMALECAFRRAMYMLRHFRIANKSKTHLSAPVISKIRCQNFILVMFSKDGNSNHFLSVGGSPAKLLKCTCERVTILSGAHYSIRLPDA